MVIGLASAAIEVKKSQDENARFVKYLANAALKHSQQQQRVGAGDSKGSGGDDGDRKRGQAGGDEKGSGDGSSSSGRGGEAQEARGKGWKRDASSGVKGTHKHPGQDQVLAGLAQQTGSNGEGNERSAQSQYPFSGASGNANSQMMRSFQPPPGVWGDHWGVHWGDHTQPVVSQGVQLEHSSGSISSLKNKGAGRGGRGAIGGAGVIPPPESTRRCV